jgi:hypothetical protein
VLPAGHEVNSNRKSASGIRHRNLRGVLDCGKEFPYDWQEMKVITSHAEADRRVHALATKHAA